MLGSSQLTGCLDWDSDSCSPCMLGYLCAPLKGGIKQRLGSTKDSGKFGRSIQGLTHILCSSLITRVDHLRLTGKAICFRRVAKDCGDMGYPVEWFLMI